MKTPYVPHIFGDEVDRKLRSRRGWLTAGVASSIPWPSEDVCIVYGGDEYFLRGSELNGKSSPPCITVACSQGGVDEALSKVYRFTSILSWFERGYVDVSGYIWGSHPMLYGGRDVYSSMGIAGKRSFNCNHLPLIEHENARRALAFWREGQRLSGVHDSYAFLSFYKVVESQFPDARQKARWINESVESLADRAGARVAELRAAGLDVGLHLFESGRCAVAHASLGREIVDPDVPADRRRLSSDLVVIEALARVCIQDRLSIPDSRTLYRTRDRLKPWDRLLPDEVLQSLRAGGSPAAVRGLEGTLVSVGLWPDGAIPGLERMTLYVDSFENGAVKVALISERQTIGLVFVLDYPKGRVHTDLEDGGLMYGSTAIDEADVRAYATFFYKVFSNGIAELLVEGCEPIDCEVVIPVNVMMTMSADQAIQAEVDKFRNAPERRPPPAG